MPFYDLSKEERMKLAGTIRKDIAQELSKQSFSKSLDYFGSDDTYIRKSAYIAVGRIYESDQSIRKNIIQLLNGFLLNDDAKVRQTVVNSAGEIGKKQFETVSSFFDKGLKDEHHTVRNAVIGSIKKMGEVNPVPVLEWAKKYLQHPDKEIRREICHGIELRGRKHPEDILPLLKTLQFDKTSRVQNTLVHVLGQISYKKGCLEKVIGDLKYWENRSLVEKALMEILDVHVRYKDFAVLTPEEAETFILANFQRCKG